MDTTDLLSQVTTLTDLARTQGGDDYRATSSRGQDWHSQDSVQSPDPAHPLEVVAALLPGETPGWHKEMGLLQLLISC